MADATFPMGDFGDGWSTGFSGHAMVGYMIAKSILLNFSAGYVSFSEKESVEGSDNSFSWVPLLLGVNYVFNPGQKFMPYVGFALGLYLASYSFSYTDIFGQTYSGDESDSNFGIAPRIGAYYLASAALLIALSAEYNVIFTEGSSTTSLGVLLGFMYALK
jgi:outer membrane protein W